MHRVLTLLAVVLLACGGASDDHGSGGQGAGSVASSGAGGSPPIDPGCEGDPTIHQGEATYYDFADGSGNCGFPATPNDLMVAAINDSQYAGSASCGACVEVTGPSGTVKLRIVDRCPECPAGDLDLSPEAFSLIADLSAGRVPIAWSYVACDVSGPIVYHFKDGSNPWWTAVQLRNHSYPIAKFEARTGDGSYLEIPRLDYNYFVADAGLGQGPLAFRVTDVAGHTLEDEGLPVLDDADAPGAGQFPICSGAN